MKRCKIHPYVGELQKILINRERAFVVIESVSNEQGLDAEMTGLLHRVHCSSTQAPL